MPKNSYSRSGAFNKRSASSKHRSKRSSKRNGVSNLTNEQKIDFIGGLMSVLGILSLVALFTREQTDLTGWVSALISNTAGWGGFILPVALTICGIYLVLRKVDRLPRLSSGRILGLILIYLNILTWLHFLNGGGINSARLGLGGGFIGFFVDFALSSTLGSAGEVVVLLAWLLVSTLFIVDISIPELVAHGRALAQKIFKSKPSSFQPPLTRPLPQPKVREPEDTVILPSGFNPLDLNSDENRRNLNRPRREVFSRQGSTAGATQPFPSSPSSQTEHLPEVHTGLKVRTQKPWPIPSISDILDPASPAAVQSHYDKDRGRIIEETLASFGAPSHIVEIHRGPAVTQFGVEPDFIENRNQRTRVRVAKIVALADDLALSLAAPSIRIQAPVPGKGYIGIEVPNTELSLVSLRELLENDTFRKIKSPLRFALGKDVAGKPVCADLTAMPHLLIAGTTNSGKSVLVNAILTSLLLNNSPMDLRLLLVDPKRVELTGYNGIPHLLAPVVVDADRVVGALQWVLREMDSRYKKFSNAGARNIVDYNQKSPDRIPYLVIVIDELADLMMLAPDETERSITRLAQLARATGIHLIIATQRPSVDVVTGLIKANFPARIAFMVASNTDSRVILDHPGADKLLGRGDMLYQAPDAPAPVRLQGVYVSDPEIQRLVDSWRVISMNRSSEGGDAPTNLVMEIANPGAPLKQGAFFEEEGPAGDPLLKDAMEIVRRDGKASISMLQRKMRVGYTRAARLVDTLEDQGIIGPQQTGSQVREVLDYGDTSESANPEEE